ncbi:hypothetical protein Taro_012640 [Colocasia esculenta]|uniref:Uncharacterized protein n=1 Tax=Colocasia esculenta TaxID=4460 RepID=A0A843UE38_COLES|nr:hypothetical protein [Colocasia esculenta]
MASLTGRHPPMRTRRTSREGFGLKTLDWRYFAFRMLQLSDSDILSNCSTSPLAESPDFVENERRSGRHRRVPPLVGSGAASMIAVKSMKRACIGAVTLDCYFKKISFMPSPSKVDLSEFAIAWTGIGVSNVEVGEGDEWHKERKMGKKAWWFGAVKRVFSPESREKNNQIVQVLSRVPLPWELLQLVLRILGHYLLAGGQGRPDK